MLLPSLAPRTNLPGGGLGGPSVYNEPQEKAQPPKIMKPKKQKRLTGSDSKSLKLKITAFGPPQGVLDEIGEGLLRRTEVIKYLGNARYRLFSVVALDRETDLKQERAPAKPQRFGATIYDYTHSRTVLVTGSLTQSRKLEIT